MKQKTITAGCRVSQIKDIVTSDIDNEKVMMSVEKGRYYGLDPVGSRVWELIETPIRVSELIDALLLEFDVDRSTCEKDVLNFIEKLHRDGIVHVESERG